MVGGVAGGLGVLATIAIVFFYIRKKRRTHVWKTTELGPEFSPTAFNSDNADGGNSHLELPFPNARTTLSMKRRTRNPDLPATSIAAPNAMSVHDLNTHPELNSTFSSQRNVLANKSLPIILAPPPSSSPAILASGTTPVSQNDGSESGTQPFVIPTPRLPSSPVTHPSGITSVLQNNQLAADNELTVMPVPTPSTSSVVYANSSLQPHMRERLGTANIPNVSIALLTDEQIRVVATLSNSGVPGTEIARVIARMRPERLTSEMGADTAPPAYNT